MSCWGQLFSRRERMMKDLDQDIRDFIERETQDNIERGMSPEQAHYAALRKFGNVTRVKEDAWEVWSCVWLEQLWRDIRFGLRMLAKNPGFTAVAVLTLALGIGATTAIFSLVDSVMLRFLPVQQPAELVLLKWRSTLQGSEDSRFTNPLWEQFRDRQDVFSSVFATSWGQEQFDLAQGGLVERANGLFASGGYFGTLGGRPAIGRLLNMADDQPGCPGAAVLSYGFWQEHFGGQRSVLGKNLSVNHHPFQIIGVSAPGFYGVEVGYTFDVAVPICAGPRVSVHRQLDQRSGSWLRVIGRLRPGMNRKQLSARLAVLSPQITAAALPAELNPRLRPRFLQQSLTTEPAATGLPDFRHELEEPLRVLMAIVGLVLLIACANIASLMLGRAASRGKEIAVRRALGASRMRLIRQLLTECILLSSAGAAIGVLLAHWGATLLVHYFSTARHQIFLNLSIDTRVLGFAAAVALITGILFGVLPAFRSTQVSLTSTMQGSDSIRTDRRARFHLDKWTASFQMALSLILLVAAGLLIRSFEKLATLDIGFDPNDVLLANVNLEGANIAPAQRFQIYNEIEQRLRGLPGVTAVSRSWMNPVGGDAAAPHVRTGSSAPPSGLDPLVFFNAISPSFIDTLRVRLLSGRNFNDQDTAEGVKVAIINQTFAQKFYPGINPVGKYFRIDSRSGKFGLPIQIVGLARNSHYLAVREESWPVMFIPISQLPWEQWDGVENFELRTATPPSLLAHPADRTIAGVNRGISVEFHTLAQQVNDSIVQEHVLAMLSAYFSTLALLLAVIGLYGTMTYLVTQRQKEFGIRIALGAQTGSILRLVMRDVTAILIAGLGLGLGISLATTRALESLLFGLHPRDTLTLVTAGAVLSVVAVVAGYIPARKATKVDPMVALRYE